MRRLVNGLLAALLLSACTQNHLDTLPQDLAHSAQDQLNKVLAARFTRELDRAAGAVVTDLARPGGYLDNPLVRIALPPPLGLALDVSRDMNADPRARLLVVLMNRAAEQAVPGAAPILRSALAKVTPDEALRLLEGGKGTASDSLRANTAAAVRAALLPPVAASLAASGAQRVYGDLVNARRAQQALAHDAKTAASGEPVHDLAQYVTEQATDGVFKALGARETRIRENLENVTGGVLPEADKTIVP